MHDFQRVKVVRGSILWFLATLAETQEPDRSAWLSAFDARAPLHPQLLDIGPLQWTTPLHLGNLFPREPKRPLLIGLFEMSFRFFQCHDLNGLRFTKDCQNAIRHPDGPIEAPAAALHLREPGLRGLRGRERQADDPGWVSVRGE